MHIIERGKEELSVFMLYRHPQALFPRARESQERL